MVLGLIGQVAIRGLLAAVICSMCVQVWTIRRPSSSARQTSKWVMFVPLLFTVVASISLLVLLITENNWYAYVSEYTGPGLPLIYRIAAFWGGNAGSLLFWALILTMYGAVVSFSKHPDSDVMLPWVRLILNGMMLFYGIVLNFSATPFTRLPAPMPGSGLNPLLQNPGMTVHPVNIYLGFVGFSIPFAYALATLIVRKSDATWLMVTRRWTLVSWLFLSVGIVYGAHWSYEELGWGGYWAWDPVENASLLPWLTATAFLHSAVIQEKRGMLKRWNILLITMTYLLTVLGTFLTRSGVLWSIHAFANAPLGRYFLTYLTLVAVFSVVLIAYRYRFLHAERTLEAVVSKESSFLLNNVLFLASAFAVLWGTIFPILSQAVTGHKMMVDTPFYNAVNLPLAVCILILMGTAPLLAWRVAKWKSIVGTVLLPALLAILLGGAATFVLYHLYHRTSILGTLGIMAAVYVAMTVFVEFYQAVLTRMALTNDSVVRSLWYLVQRNRRRYGGYIVHLAVAVIAIGIAASGSFHVDMQKQLSPGDQPVKIGDYSLTFVGMGTADHGLSKDMYANLVVQRGGTTLGLLQPSATFYTDGESPTTNVALYTRPLQDLYVVMLGTANGNSAVFDIHINPFVQFIWLGGYLFIVGTLVSLWPASNRTRVATVRTPFETGLLQQRTDIEYDYHSGKMDDEAYAHAQTEWNEAWHQLESMQQLAAANVQRLIADESASNFNRKQREVMLESEAREKGAES